MKARCLGSKLSPTSTTATQALLLFSGTLESHCLKGYSAGLTITKVVTVYLLQEGVMASLCLDSITPTPQLMASDCFREEEQSWP